MPAPTKPKLVARAAGSETSPWKVKKDAPKISAKDVPGALRPLLSCALWRLHESIERNDANQLFLLSDQTETGSIAQKLNIIARPPKEFAATIASKTSRIGLDTFGDLEQEFGFQQKSAALAIRNAEEVRVENGVLANPNEDLSKGEDAMDNSISSEGTVNTDASSIVHEQDLEKPSSERKRKESSVNGDCGEEKSKEHDVIAETTATLAPRNPSEQPAKSVESIKSLVDSIIQQGSEKRLSESVNDLKLDCVESQSDLSSQPALENSTVLSQPETLLLQPQNVESLQHVQEAHAVSGTSTSERSTTHSTPILEAAQEPEDSDEEVVVFIPQPKRLSAQHKPAQQGSRPSTPKELPPQKPAGQSPSKSLVKPQTKGKTARHSPNPSFVGQAHPQTVSPPTVIDPDAFGRDFRVNINPSPRPPHHPNSHSNHRARGNGHNTQTGQVPRNLPRQVARTSPPRNVAQENLRSLPPVPGPAAKVAPNHRRQVSRTSPRRGPVPKAQEELLPDVESIAPTAAAFSKSQNPESHMVEPTSFVPQTAFPTGQLESKAFRPETCETTDPSSRSALPKAPSDSNATEPRVYDVSEFVPRPPRPVRELKTRTPRPKVIEATEIVPKDFVPRATLPRTQAKQYMPEPDSIEPRPSMNDVDYVLKSGSTRASARGRGRLWTPS